jgi:hypothetical protein
VRWGRGSSTKKEEIKVVEGVLAVRLIIKGYVCLRSRSGGTRGVVTGQSNHDWDNRKIG